jgi:UDP-glucose 4-epimerase
MLYYIIMLSLVQIEIIPIRNIIRNIKSMKNILVTGGAGYVGSQTCKLLKEKGYTPVVFDNLVYGHKYAVKWGDLVIGDLNNFTEIDSAIKKYQPVAVIHCAAYTYVGESVSTPAKYYENNVVGSLNLFNAMLKNNVKNIVFSSTCATFGNIEKFPLLESTPQNPISPYGMSKLMVENILKDFDHAYGLKSVIVRYFNVSGADYESEVGEDHTPESHIIPLVLDVALGISDHIKMFGDDYPTKDGTCIRDYIHTEDLANAHVLSLEYLFKNNTSNDFNLGSETGYSVKEIINAVEKVSNKPVKIVVSPRRAGDPASLVATAKKAKEVLGWEAKYKDIYKIVETAYKWHLKLQEIRKNKVS